MRIPVLAELATSLLLATCASSNPSAPLGYSGEFTASAVLARAIAAAGGDDRVRLPDSVHSRSRVTLIGAANSPIEAELEYWAEGASRERRELVTSDGHTLLQLVRDGRSLEIEDERITERDLATEFSDRCRYRSILADFAADPRIRLVKDPQLDERTTIALERSVAPDRRWQLWLDAATSRVIRIRRISTANGRTTIDEDLLDQQERFGGRWIARHQDTRRDGRPVKEAWLLEFDESCTIDPTLFDLDAARAAAR